MTDHALQGAFEAYRAAVTAERHLVDEITARHDKRPSAADNAELERLGAEITRTKAECERLSLTTESGGVKTATATLLRIHEAASQARDDLTVGQRKDWARAAGEIHAAADEVRDLRYTPLSGAYDRLCDALRANDRANASLYAKEVNRLTALAVRSREVDAVRGQFGSLFTKDDTMERTSTAEGGIAHLWTEYRDNNFAAMDARLSPEIYQNRALGSIGGTAIATTFADQVVVYQRTLSPMLNPDVVTISTSNSGAPFKVPRLTADVSLGGTVTAEAAAITEADPTIGAAELTPYKFGGITLWSAELNEDEIIDLQPLIARSHARAIALGAGAYMTTGDGSGKPTGFIQSATNGGTATKAFGGTATVFLDYGDLVGLWGSIAAPYRSTGVWQVSNTALVAISRFRDDHGNLLLLPGMGRSAPTIMGRPVYENPAMAPVGSASKSVAFGDFSQYWVRRVAPLRIELSRDYKFNTDQVALKVVDRLDGELVDAAAVAYLVSADD